MQPLTYLLDPASLPGLFRRSIALPHSRYDDMMTMKNEGEKQRYVQLRKVQHVSPWQPFSVETANVHRLVQQIAAEGSTSLNYLPPIQLKVPLLHRSLPHNFPMRHDWMIQKIWSWVLQNPSDNTAGRMFSPSQTNTDAHPLHINLCNCHKWNECQIRLSWLCVTLVVQEPSV